MRRLKLCLCLLVLYSPLGSFSLIAAEGGGGRVAAIRGLEWIEVGVSDALVFLVLAW